MNIKKQKTNIAKITIVAILILNINACKEKDKDIPPQDDTELITTIKLVFKDSISLTETYAVFKDIDGPGGNGPAQFDTIRLNANQTYFTRIYLLDESKVPADTVSNEVLKEANQHLFVYTPSSVMINVKAEDKDENNLPLGLLTKWRTGNKATGRMKITLKHQPGVKDGTATPGETDVELEFNCVIK